MVDGNIKEKSQPTINSLIAIFQGVRDEIRISLNFTRKVSRWNFYILHTNILYLCVLYQYNKLISITIKDAYWI